MSNEFFPINKTCSKSLPHRLKIVQSNTNRVREINQQLNNTKSRNSARQQVKDDFNLFVV